MELQETEDVMKEFRDFILQLEKITQTNEEDKRLSASLNKVIPFLVDQLVAASEKQIPGEDNATSWRINLIRLMQNCDGYVQGYADDPASIMLRSVEKEADELYQQVIEQEMKDQEDIEKEFVIDFDEFKKDVENDASKLIMAGICISGNAHYDSSSSLESPTRSGKSPESFEVGSWKELINIQQNSRVQSASETTVRSDIDESLSGNCLVKITSSSTINEKQDDANLETITNADVDHDYFDPSHRESLNRNRATTITTTILKEGEMIIDENKTIEDNEIALPNDNDDSKQISDKFEININQGPQMYIQIRNMIDAHLFEKHQRYQYLCWIEGCQKGFSNVLKFDKHFSSIHPTCKQFTCSLCKDIFGSYHLKHTHEITCHKDMFIPRCTEPGCRYDLSDLVDQVEDDSIVTCPMCGKELRSKRNLKSHFQTHRSFKPYQCTICSLFFNHTSTCIRHIKIVHRQQLSDNCNKMPKDFMRIFNGEELRNITPPISSLLHPPNQMVLNQTLAKPSTIVESHSSVSLDSSVKPVTPLLVPSILPTFPPEPIEVSSKSIEFQIESQNTPKAAAALIPEIIELSEDELEEKRIKKSLSRITEALNVTRKRNFRLIDQSYPSKIEKIDKNLDNCIGNDYDADDDGTDDVDGTDIETIPFDNIPNVNVESYWDEEIESAEQELAMMRLTKFKIIALRCSVEQCSAIFRTREKLNKHFTDYHHRLPYSCLKVGCKISWDVHQKLANHVRGIHRSTIRWQCGPCLKENRKFEFGSYKSLYHHHRIVHEQGVFTCAECRISTKMPTRVDVWRHARYAHHGYQD